MIDWKKAGEKAKALDAAYGKKPVSGAPTSQSVNAAKSGVALPMVQTARATMGQGAIFLPMGTVKSFTDGAAKAEEKRMTTLPTPTGKTDAEELRSEVRQRTQLAAGMPTEQVASRINTGAQNQAQSKEAWDASAAGIKAKAETRYAELDKLRKRQTQLRARLIEADNGVDVSQPLQMGNIQSMSAELSDVTRSIQALEREQNKTRQNYYVQDNEEKFSKLSGDESGQGLYTTAGTAGAPDVVIRRVLSSLEQGGSLQGDPDAVAQIRERFGVSPETSGSTAQYMNDLTALLGRDDLGEDIQAEAVDELKRRGYDYTRMSGYKQTKKEAAEYARKQAEREEAAKKYPVQSSIVSVLAAPAKGLDFLQVAGRALGANSDERNLDTYVPLNPYRMEATNLVNTIRSTVSDEIEKNTDFELAGQNVASFLYNTGMSVAESAAQVATLGPAATIFMGASAASDTAQDVMARGGSNQQAFWGGLAAGAAETIFEKFSIDNLLKPRTVDSVKTLLRETAKQAGVEASEEVFTEIANILSDAAIMGGNSNFNVAVQSYMNQGMSADEARKKAYLDNVANVAWAGVGGALSGGVMGGAVSGTNYVMGRQQTSGDSSSTLPSVADRSVSMLPGADVDNKTVSTGETAQSWLVPLSDAERKQLSTGKKNFVADTLSDIVSFARNALSQKGGSERLYMGKVPDSTAEMVRESVGVDIAGYNAILPGDSVQHIFKQHGDPMIESARGQRAVTAEDIAMIPQVVAEPDSVHMSDSVDSAGRNVLIFSKQIGDMYITAQAVTDGRHALTTDTIWIQKKKGPQVTTSDVGITADPAHNAQSVPPQGLSSDTTILQPEGGVKGQYVQESAENTLGGDSVGAAKSKFGYQQKDSRVGSNTYSKMYSEVLGELESAGADLSTLPYDVVTEKQSVERAQQRLFTDLEGEISDLPQRAAWSGEDLDTAMGVLDRYLADAKESGDYQKANEWAKLVQEKGTQAGQMIQAFAKYSRTPQGILVDAVSTLDKTKLNQERKNSVLADVQRTTESLDSLKDGDKAGAIALIRDASYIRKTGDFFRNRLSSQLDAALEGDSFEHLKAVATAQASSIASDYLPKDKGKVIKAWHSQLMLSNLATFMRNFVGNNVFDPVDAWAGSTSMVPLDILLSKFTGTRSTAVDKSWFSSAKRQGAIDGMLKSYIESALDVDIDGIETRYGQTSRRTFKMTGGVFERFLSAWAKYQSYALNVTDDFQKGGIQTEGQRGIDALKERGQITDNSLDAHGEELAKYRTFQDNTAASAAMMGLHDIGNLIGVGDSGKTVAGGKVHSFGAGDLFLPFSRVPANLVSRAAEYSPLGFAKGAEEVIGVLRDAKRGTLTAAQQAKAVSDVGRGLTGTALIASFAALAMAGVLRVADDDNDKDVEAQNAAEGATGTQLNLDAAQRWLSGGDTTWKSGDTLMSIGFLEPINAQMTTGALVAQELKNGEASPWSFLKSSADGTIQSLLDLPVMSNLQSLVDGYTYSDAETTGGKIVDAAVSFGAGNVSSILLPNVVKAAAKAGDQYYRDGYTSESVAGQTVDSLKMGLPGLRETLPIKLTPFGENKEYGGNGVTNALNSMLLPGAVTTYRQDDVSRELQRVREATGESNIYPDRNAPRTVKYGGETYELTAAERETYQRRRGTLTDELMTAIIGTDQYKNAPVDEQSAILSDAVGFANDTAKREMLAGQGITYKSSQWEKAYKAVEAGVGFDVYLDYNDRLSALKEQGKTSDANAAVRKELMSDSRLTTAQKSVLDETLLSDTVIIPKDVTVDYGDGDSFIITQMSAAAQKKWPDIRDTFGLSAEDYREAYQAYTNDGMTAAEKKKKLQDIVGGYAAGNRLYTELGKKDK
ncbi:hypothetical protein KL86CLO1_11643 [uncultured Eubacteriales bacterium]|uniref:Phage-Barnase-EndoU-ColicinE5/D-RelE like nuclease 3 domain-containing protein n=1 Tax=uncultured Eubacteriales bacterium TaxID=172733 RepID=A0A212JSJ4_9FIRM|nr:hypothetical protein KL86CLO1_11643 [uncultured Eubacteriales bacterium]